MTTAGTAIGSGPPESSRLRVVALPVLAGILLGGAWLALALFFLHQVKSADVLRNLADEVRITLLESRRREKDFLLRSLKDPAFYVQGTTFHLRQHHEALAELVVKSQELAARVTSDWRMDLGKMTAKARDYAREFDALVDCYSRLGDPDHGLEGSFRGDLRNLSRAVLAAGNPSLTQGLLELEAETERYFIQHDVNRWTDAADRLQELIHRELPAPAVQEGLDRLRGDLRRYRAVEREIGFTEDEGLQFLYRTSAHEIEPLAIVVTERAGHQYVVAVRRLMAGVLAASILLTGLLSTTFLLTRAARIRSRHLTLVASDLSRSNEELQQFAYVASHDLQEPLRAVAGCVQLLQQRAQGRLDSRCDELIQHSVEGALRMQTLIEDLLTLSRVGTHTRPATICDSGEVLDAALANLAAPISETGATVTRGPLPALPMDPTQITQVFQNLIGNSLKFRGPRTPVIHISADRLPEHWKFSVRDNGIGIEPQYFEKIFQIFQRLHTRREYPGSGIGLAVCRKILIRHGGNIWLESELNQGTVFHFTLPDASENP